jgi:hypothetical protein
MATILWTSATAANWNTPSAWQGGVVPGVNDIAVFTSVGNGGGAGNCTLDIDPTILGWELHANYVGTFNYNGKQFKVGNAGVGKCFIGKEVAQSNGASLLLYCKDVLLTSQHVQIIFYENCNLWLADYGIGKMQIQSNKTVTFRRSAHPDYASFTPKPNFIHSEGLVAIYGTLDVSEAWTILSINREAVPQWYFLLGTIRNTGTHNILFEGHSQGNFSVGKLEGNFSLDFTIGVNNCLIENDLRQFTNVAITVDNNSSITGFSMVNATYNQVKFTMNAPQHVRGIMPDTVQTLTGDFTVTQTGVGELILQTQDSVGAPKFILTGGNDQVIDIAKATFYSPVNIKSNKVGGLVTITTNDSQTIQLSQKSKSNVAEYKVLGLGVLALESDILTTWYSIDTPITLVDYGYQFILIKDLSQKVRHQWRLDNRGTLGYHSVRIDQFNEEVERINKELGLDIDGHSLYLEKPVGAQHSTPLALVLDDQDGYAFEPVEDVITTPDSKFQGVVATAADLPATYDKAGKYYLIGVIGESTKFEKHTWDGTAWVKEKEFAATAVGKSSDNTFMIEPDLSKKETINRITENNGTWTVDRNGFVYLSVWGASTEGTQCSFYKNGSLYHTVGCYKEIGGNVAIIMPVTIGDVVKMSFADTNGTGPISNTGTQCYFIPPKIIWASTDATKFNTRLIGQPDYAKQEDTNRISTNSGEWVADRDGYIKVRCRISASPTQVAGTFDWGSLNIFINDKSSIVGHAYCVDHTADAYIPERIYPISKGDKIKLQAQGGQTTFSDFVCFFIPPKTVAPMCIKGADVLSNDRPGGVIIDPVTKTMSVNQTWEKTTVNLTGIGTLTLCKMGSLVLCHRFYNAQATWSDQTIVGTVPEGWRPSENGAVIEVFTVDATGKLWQTGFNVYTDGQVKSYGTANKNAATFALSMWHI